MTLFSFSPYQRMQGRSVSWGRGVCERRRGIITRHSVVLSRLSLPSSPSSFHYSRSWTNTPLHGIFEISIPARITDDAFFERSGGVPPPISPSPPLPSPFSPYEASTTHFSDKIYFLLEAPLPDGGLDAFPPVQSKRQRGKEVRIGPFLLPFLCLSLSLIPSDLVGLFSVTS